MAYRRLHVSQVPFFNPSTDQYVVNVTPAKGGMYFLTSKKLKGRVWKTSLLRLNGKRLWSLLSMRGLSNISDGMIVVISSLLRISKK